MQYLVFKLLGSFFLGGGGGFAFFALYILAVSFFKHFKDLLSDNCTNRNCRKVNNLKDLKCIQLYKNVFKVETKAFDFILRSFS